MTDHGDADLHLRAIRKALTDGNAAVMVGSGFSRNADGGDQLATWPELAELLWNELNPTGKASGSYSAGQVTQLGEQYVHVFSRPALENLLKREIPDDKVSPGDLHDQLLQLPWSDIFTTNYDTLLERAAEKDIERAHYTVSCREDIPQSKVLNRRRIVKLHGSFPSQRPFIFTDEEYRRYPNDFAPFVNMVRQSLLENVFCLVGFSGDDPNFLHWVGWIRDMLDKHALPIYLFVDKEPPLGQRRLLDSRRITVVVLPSDSQAEPGDYRSRYATLFRILATPLKPDDSEWTASLQFPEEFRTHFTEDIDEKISRLLSVVPRLRKFRASYPGWLVAPSTIRRNLERRLQGLPISLDAKVLYAHVDKTPTLVSIVLLDQYAWFQDVLLLCFDDALAEIAIRLIRGASELSNGVMFAKESEDLKKIGILQLRDVQMAWRGLSLALLRWARQELHEAYFEELKTLLQKAFPSDQDLDDEVMHETILFALYSGERDVARRGLLDWNLRSSDAYMGVRKGALLAEVGEGVVGLSVSVDALQALRRRQKLRPDSARYLSEEAWANYIVQRQHDAIGAFTAKPTPDGSGDARISRRLADLAAKGFNVQAEIRGIAADLDAEAQPPSAPHVMQQHFDIGEYSPSYRVGNVSLKQKICAAFAWLSMADRVGLVPRMHRVSFDIESYTQAAWWLQYFDSPQRVLSVAVRTLNRSVLKPKDDTKPPHLSGWLSRFQVAKSEESLAMSMCQRSLSIVERDLAEGSADLGDSVEFHLEVMSRFVVRISDTAFVKSLTERVIRLHETTHLASEPNLWRDASDALKRCFEALPYEIQDEFAVRIASIPSPVVPGRNKEYVQHYSAQWLSLHKLYRPKDRRCEDESLLMAATRIGEQLLKSLRGSDGVEKPSDVVVGQIWERFVWLDHFGLLSESLKLALGQALWHDADGWPCVPGRFFAELTYRWPVPSGIDADGLLRKWVLTQTLHGFSTTVQPITPSGTPGLGWTLNVSDHFLQTWKCSLEKQPWSPAEMRAGLSIVKAWWDAEWVLIEQSIDRFDALRSMVVDRLDDLDAVLSIGLSPSWATNEQLGEQLTIWLREVVQKGQDHGAMFWRLRLRDDLQNNDVPALSAIQREMTRDLLNISSLQDAQAAAQVLNEWVAHEASAYRPALLLDGLVGLVSSRRMPNLVWALHLLVKIVQFKPQWLTDEMVMVIELGLDALLRELAYQDRTSGTGMSDSDVPLLRFNCARLAFALSSTKWFQQSQTWPQWLQQASNDPLPEMRYLRERWVGPIPRAAPRD